jgi:large subunit ribosomal protein L15
MGNGLKRRHRGKGSKGGKGNAWCKHLWVKTLKEEGKHKGRQGFHNPTRVEQKVINVGTLCQICDHLLEHNKNGAVTKEGKSVKIELSKLKIDKVLGFGKVDRPLVVVGCASKSAIKKIEQAGGKVVC